MISGGPVIIKREREREREKGDFNKKSKFLAGRNNKETTRNLKIGDRSIIGIDNVRASGCV
jgi:hypothetical protein